ncbi:alpha/beta hydrolase [Dyadobacter sp. CY356]|uniref:alpha/beta hydrolase n=1 Tax=Dyadobacter sp. CY356 TaxID=2906442 RepID=UPI001EECE291|nr:alpha/beta hydrolase-fold protein [Dyadobacter sp. CY356]MCF0057117.1 alpha/beta hydrolase [Dyadobacter sp. CY356]
MKLLTTILLFAVLTTRTFAQKNKSIEKEESKPFVIGVIDGIQSTILSEKRVLNIYLPEGYSKTDTTKYPVVYLLDGSADEDFIHVSGLFQFNNFSWINRVPKSIIVGIANVDRRRDFTYPTTIESDKKKNPTAGHSEKFIRFLEKELQPFIEKKYKTNSSKMLIGQSLGGLLATEILLKKPRLFSKYIIISPSLWWDNGSLLNHSSEILEENFSNKTDVYIGVGKEGLTPGTIPRVMEVDANLLAGKLQKFKNKNLTVYFDYLPQENHATITHQAIFNALRLLYPVNKLAD